MRSSFEQGRAVAIWSAFRHTGRLLFRRAKPARAGIASLMSIAAAALCLPQASEAAQVIVTITGVVDGPNANYVASSGALPVSLIGDNFKLIFTIDDLQGQQATQYYNNIVSGSSITSLPSSNPITAVLTVGGHSFSFGTLSGAGITSGASRSTGVVPYGTVNFGVSETLKNGSSLVADDAVGIAPAHLNNPPFSPNYSWESPLSYTYASTPTGPNGEFAYDRIPTGGEAAGGFLTATSITVEGPQPPSAVSQPFIIDPVASRLLNGPNIVTVPDALAGAQVTVQGVAADGATEVVIAAPASTVGEQLQISISPSGDPDSYGSLASLGGSNAGNTVTVPANSTLRGPIAFAVYIAPKNFVSNAQDVSTSTRYISLQI